MNQFYGNSQGATATALSQSNPSTQRARKKSSSKAIAQQQTAKQQPVIIIHQNNANQVQQKQANNGGVKIRRDDLKLIQQYCEQNDLGMIEIPQNMMIKQGMNNPASNGNGHKKTKSEGATPIGSNYMKAHFAVKQQQQQQQQMPMNMLAQQQMQQLRAQQHTPVLDYQKFLEDEKVYQYPKAKSSMGYYTQNNTPNSNTGRVLPQQKSPELFTYHGPHYNSQMQHQQNIPMVAQSNQSMISQSALSNYPTGQNTVLMQSRAAIQGQNGTRSMSRKKSIPQPTSTIQNNYQMSQSIHPPTLNYNSSNLSSIQNLFMSKNPSSTSYKVKGQNSLMRPSVHEQYSIDANTHDMLNESSVYMYDDPLMRSNQQLSILSKQKPMLNSQYASQQQDESYIDATIYEQFMQGPHNLSQYSTSKGIDEHSYSQYMTRSVSQNQHPQPMKPQKFIRESPSAKVHHHTRTNSQQTSQTGQQMNGKTKRTANQNFQNSLNNSGPKQIDRRMLMGRTPSPNFLKRIAGLMSLPQESLVIQQHMYKNQHNNTSKNLPTTSGTTTRRSQSKQQFSTNQQASNTAKLMGTANLTQQQLNKSLKQKFAKQSGSNYQVNRYKSGSITTGANTAQNSPSNRGVTPKRNNIKQKTIQTIQQQQQQLYQQQIDYEQLAESFKKQAYLGQVAMNNQNKLRRVNQDEEKKALAMISSIDNQMISKHTLSQQQVLQPQQFYQPVKMIGEIMEEDPQPLSSHEFLNFEDVKVIQVDNNRSKRSNLIQVHNTKGSHKSHHSQTPNHYFDGGTGSNQISQNQNQLVSKNSILSNETQTYSQNPSYINPSNDQNQITQYLEQLQSIRQSQKFQQKSVTAMHSPHESGFKPQYLIDQKPSFDKAVHNYQSNRHPVKTKTQSSLIKMIDEEDTQQEIYHQEQQQQYDQQSQKYNRKKTQSVEPPKIATPSVDMFKMPMNELEEKLKEHTNFQKKQTQINLQEKTPFEKELEQKAHEMKKHRQTPQPSQDRGTTEEQIKPQKYKEDSISLLKQLQESGNITEALLESKAQTLTKCVGEYKKPAPVPKSNASNKQLKQLQPTVLSQKSENIVEQQAVITKQKTQAQVKQPSFKQQFEDSFEQKDKEGDDPVMMTEEDERQIKEVISDLNEKAFYGKILKKTKRVESDHDLIHLSPRSREIATVMRFIKQSFDDKGEPPVTTTDFYRIGKMLGRGAFGKVNLAMHKLVRKLVAIKSLNKECLTDEAQKAKLMKEVSLLLKLRHNHIVKIYETIETEKHIIIVMELCAGGDLLNYVRKRRRLKEPYAKVIFKQIIDGLCYIHSKYIAHRDIKLDNILLDGKGNVKIGDFGISKQTAKGQKMTEQCGTPAYIAPEILKDKGYSFNVDLWSAGVVLFAMLYGTVPFKANNMEELHKLILKGKYTLKDDISIEARNLLRGLLEVNPEKRLTIKQIYRHKWFEDLDPNLQLFNDQEREQIKKEYTYNDPRRYNRNENEEPVDCFTEHHLESVYQSLQNATSKSIILAPFNSTQSQLDPKAQECIHKLLCEKMMVLNFARRCREIDRQYEFNNNGDLDNGVYHKQAYNSDDSEDKDGDDKINHNSDLLSIPMLMSEKKPRKRGGRASVENSFEDTSSIQQMQERHQIAQKIKEGSQINKELRNKRGVNNDIDDELVATYETFQSKYSNQLDEEKIKTMVTYGYPHQYVVKSLDETDPNYCTAGYYLLCMDQNYC